MSRLGCRHRPGILRKIWENFNYNFEMTYLSSAEHKDLKTLPSQTDRKVFLGMQRMLYFCVTSYLDALSEAE